MNMDPGGRLAPPLTMETWKEDRLHIHTRGKTQAHHSHKGRRKPCTAKREKKRTRRERGNGERQAHSLEVILGQLQTES